MRRVAVCRACVALFSGIDRCPRCRAQLEVSIAAFEAWEQKRLERRIADWHRAELIDDDSREKLEGAASAPLPPAAPEPGAAATVEAANADSRIAIERSADDLFASTSTFLAELQTRYAALAAPPRPEPAAPPPSEPAVTRDVPDKDPPARGHREAPDDPENDSDTDDDSDDDGDDERLTAADRRSGRFSDARRDAPPAAPLGALQVFWFIGAILVLAGSLMGVREAWRSLEGVMRPLVIAGALFAYHVAFVVLSRVLARRSETSGRVLGVIAVGLAPIAFVAVAVAAGMSRTTGIGAAAVLLAACCATFLAVGRVFTPGVGTGLLLGLVPCLALEVPLGAEDDASPLSLTVRLLVPLVALAPLGLAAVRARVAIVRGAGRAGSSLTTVTRASGVSAQVLASLAGAAYGALAVALFALFGGPNVAALDPGRFGAPLLACLAWVGLAAFIGWVATAGGALARELPRAAPVLRIVLLAVLAGAALMGSGNALVAGRERLLAEGVLAFAPCTVAALATIALFLEQRRHPGALHFAIPIAHVAVALDAFVLFQRAPVYALAAMGLVPAALLLAAPHVKDRARRTAIAVWSTASSIILVFVVVGAEPAVAGAPLVVSSTLAGCLALAAHVGGRAVRPGQHYLGAVLALLAACLWLVPSRPESAWFTIALALDAVAIAYGALGLAHGMIVKRDVNAGAIDWRPFDDVSLLAAILAVYLGWVVLGPGMRPLRGAEADAVGALLPTAVAAGVLALRAVRDRSRIVTLHSGLAVGIAVELAITSHSARALAANALATSAPLALGTLVSGWTALLLMLPATLRTEPAKEAPRFGRPLLGFVPLPLGGRGRTLLDGYGIAALVFAALSLTRGVSWIANGDYSSLGHRELVVLGLVGVVVAVLVTFLGRGLELLRARGNVVTLAAGGAVIGVGALAYRIGRPLPPEVVGWRLTLVLAAVWILARVIAHHGPRLADVLGRPSHGVRYHVVPHAGVLALGALLLYDALVVGAPTWTRALAVTPPTLLFGGGLAMLLLYRSSGARPFLHLAFGSFFLFACFAAAQMHVLGPALAPLDPPGGRWMLADTLPAVRLAELAETRGTWRYGLSRAWLDPGVFLRAGDSGYLLAGRAIVGAAGATGVSALLLLAASRAAGRVRREGHVLGFHLHDLEAVALVWLTIGAAVNALAIAWQPSVVGALVLLAAGAIALAARAPVLRAAPLVLGAPLFVHALAHTASALPAWAGPALAALAVLVIVAGLELSRRAGRDATTLLASQTVAALYAALAITYATAARGELRPPEVGGAWWRVLDLAQAALGGGFAQTGAVPITLGVLAVGSAVASSTWRGGLARLTAILPPLVLGAAGATAVASHVFTTPLAVLSRTLTHDAPLLATALAASFVVAHAASLLLEARRRADHAWGTRVGRDVLLGTTATTMAFFVIAGDADVAAPTLPGALPIVAALLVAAHAVTRDGGARHVYFVEIALVLLYAFVTRTMSLRPEVDAFAGLGYGFVLLGVASVARRRGLVRVADPTWRFLALLPVLVAFATLRGPANATFAMFAFGASLLYFVVALTEGSRTFGSLSAVAANVALVTFAIAQGLDGIEIWLGPLGLLFAAISQIFAPKLSAAARSAVRVTGGVLLYLPAGAKLALRLGAAEDATYSVVFGAICLLGVLAGVVLKVRAYLALATLALTLDVVANLLYAGLRDHRLGFVLLSASGLAILGAMILVTLRRDRARALIGTVRTQLSAWD